MFTLKTKCFEKKVELSRDWMFYSKAILCSKLVNVDFNLANDNVQDCWNDFENKLIVVIDEILPMRTHFNDVIIQPPVRLLSTN